MYSELLVRAVKQNNKIPNCWTAHSSETKKREVSRDSPFTFLNCMQKLDSRGIRVLLKRFFFCFLVSIMRNVQFKPVAVTSGVCLPSFMVCVCKTSVEQW